MHKPLFSKGFGRAVSEAMSVGKPIITTDSGGGTELVDKNSAIVVPIKNSKAIGQAVSKLVNDDALRVEMGKNANKRIQTVFHIDKTIEETLALYKKLLNG